MPILNIVLNQDCTTRQKARLLDSVTRAVAESLGAPLSNIRATLQTLDAQDTIVAGETGKSMAQVNAYLLPGRTDAQKQALIAALSRALADCINVSDQDSRIIIQTIPTADMGVAGGISARMAGR